MKKATCQKSGKELSKKDLTTIYEMFNMFSHQEENMMKEEGIWRRNAAPLGPKGFDYSR